MPFTISGIGEIVRLAPALSFVRAFKPPTISLPALGLESTLKMPLLLAVVKFVVRIHDPTGILPKPLAVSLNELSVTDALMPVPVTAALLGTSHRSG